MSPVIRSYQFPPGQQYQSIQKLKKKNKKNIVVPAVTVENVIND